MIACGALAGQVRELARRMRLPVEVHSLSARLHDRPDRIAPAVTSLARPLLEAGRDVVVAYADCGTYGALDLVCDRLGLERLPGLHCYDLVAGPAAIRAIMVEEPGTYLLTDFLVQSFHRLVVVSLGLDRHPELVEDYFGHYRRLVWLAHRPTPALERQAGAVATLLDLPLEVRSVGDHHFAGAVRTLLRARRP